MKVYIFVMFAVVCSLQVLETNADAKPFFDKLFSGYDSSYGSGGYGSYGNSYGGYYPSRPRSYGRSYGNEGGGERYKSICRIHAVDSFAFPGQVGRPVCP